MQTPSAQPGAVTRRHVFYIPGYDPFHPRRYRELYRKEGAAQAAISGYRIHVSPGGSTDAFGWHVDAEIDGQKVHTKLEVLVWSDIVRASMSQSILATYAQLVRTSWIYISTGALFRLMRLRKGPVIAALYPVLFLVTQLMIACWLGWITALGANGITGVVWFGAILGLGATWAVLEAFRRKDNKLFAYYLMHDYAFSARWNGANPPELEERLALFQTRIKDALQTDVDEVLLVGHSSGAHLAISVLAEILRDNGVAAERQKLALLSLGHVVPMMSFLPDANRLRADLKTLSRQKTVPWIDVSAPGDGCAFALCDPVAVSGVRPDRAVWPLVISAAFRKTLSAERLRSLRWRFFRLHFQYLCAFDVPDDYDYFKITAGPCHLRERFAERNPSPSRITSPLSGYTDVTRVVK